MRSGQTIRILFIGNSHTYYNDLPLIVRQIALGEGFPCETTMLAHGGWYLAQHAQEPDVRFNLLHGGYDFVVLQEHAHPFGPEEKLLEAAVALNALIRAGGAVPVLFESWARKSEPELQAGMNAAHRRVADEIGALLAPVGELWQAYQQSVPALELYAEDGAHASPAGSAFAASCIWQTIRAAL